MAPGSCQSSHHGVQASAMETSERLPAASATEATASTIGSSYDSSWAAARIAPSREYLFADAQPAINVPMIPTPMTASTRTTLASTVAPTTVGDSGMTASATRYGMSATKGARRNARRSARAGVMSSFCTNFTPSATSWAHRGSHRHTSARAGPACAP